MYFNQAEILQTERALLEQRKDWGFNDFKMALRFAILSGHGPSITPDTIDLSGMSGVIERIHQVTVDGCERSRTGFIHLPDCEIAMGRTIRGTSSNVPVDLVPPTNYSYHPFKLKPGFFLHTHPKSTPTSIKHNVHLSGPDISMCLHSPVFAQIMISEGGCLMAVKSSVTPKLTMGEAEHRVGQVSEDYLATQNRISTPNAKFLTKALCICFGMSLYLFKLSDLRARKVILS